MTSSPSSTVTITVPANLRYFRSVRLAIGGVATLVGFDVESMEDLRIGVDELCTALLEAGNGDDLRFEVHVDSGQGLRIQGTSSRGELSVDTERFAFSRQILSVVADSYGFDVTDSTVTGWLERAVTDDDLRDDGTASDGDIDVDLSAPTDGAR